ncbi:hypothetical protein Hanom_Chr04g00314321 [Helianthus anomalus]
MIAGAADMMCDQFNLGLLKLAAVSPESASVSISISENLLEEDVTEGVKVESSRELEEDVTDTPARISTSRSLHGLELRNSFAFIWNKIQLDC